MREAYIFSISAGLDRAGADVDAVTVLQSLGYPLEALIVSTSYDKVDTCISECVNFINTQNSQAVDSKTTIEANPFLSGESAEMPTDVDAKQRQRWAGNELLKVHAVSSATTSLISCSVFKVIIPTGFITEGNNTLH